MRTAAKETTRKTAAPRFATRMERPGRALDTPIRTTMESRFLHDFTSVRVHTDTVAANAVRALDALAFTIGNDVYFGYANYQPHTPAGRSLLAHELTHVVQQHRSGQPKLQRKPVGTTVEDEDEREAEANGGSLREGSAEKPKRPLFGGRRKKSAPPTSAPSATQPAAPTHPAAATLTDPRLRVRGAERELYNTLRRYLAYMKPRLQQLVTAGRANHPWLTADNPNVQAVLTLVDELIQELGQETLIVRFDKPMGVSTAASYDEANNVMSLRPFADRAELAGVAASALHEYVHVKQDRAIEAQLAGSLRAQPETAATEAGSEIEARRLEVYLDEMLRISGEPLPLGDLSTRLGTMKFLRLFEQERTGGTTQERETATREIRTDIETAYASQIQRAANTKSYVIEIDAQNHALLHWDLPGRATPYDLGAITVQATDTELLKRFLIATIKQQPDYQKLFARPGGQPFTLLSIVIAHQGKAIGSFAVRP